MTEQREARDVLAEAMRRERYGLITPQWQYADEAMREPIRQRADFLIKQLYDAGYAVVSLPEGDAPPEPPVYNPVISRFEAPGATGVFRMIKAAGGARFSVILDESETKQTVECSFTMSGVALLADRILMRDLSVQKEPQLLTTLAAATEVYRLLECPWILPE